MEWYAIVITIPITIVVLILEVKYTSIKRIYIIIIVGEVERTKVHNRLLVSILSFDSSLVYLTA